MTEEIQQPDNSTSNENNSPPVSADSSNTDSKSKIDNKKEKCKPMTKVVIRRLPPTMTQSQFVEQVSPLPDNDYLYFVKGDMSLGQYAFSRAYINFIEQKDIFDFREKFDNYVFLDAKGTEYPAVVEFAPFQRLPKKRIGKKKDAKAGTIDSDPYFINFLESLKNQEVDTGVGQPKTEYSFQPFENVQKKVTTTPLLEYLKQRKQDKQRARDEKREERRRRDLERRRAKDEPTISKVLKNPDVERELSRENKENKEGRDKIIITAKDTTKNRKRDEGNKTREKPMPTRDRETKGAGKSYEKKTDRDGKNSRKHDEKKTFNRREDKDNNTKDDKKYEVLRGIKESKDEIIKEKKNEEKKGKSYEKMRKEKRKLAELKKQMDKISDVPKESIKKEDVDKKKVDNNVELVQKKVEKINENSGEIKKNTSEKKKFKDTEGKNDNETRKIARSSTFEMDSDENIENTRIKKIEKIAKRRSSLESGGDNVGGDSAHLRRHKSLDGGEDNSLQNNERERKEKGKKESKTSRRIRNKDRPAMEIYRPGMGKFSKQRLERGKSTTDDRVSSSESPTPGAKSSSSTITHEVSSINPVDTKTSEINSVALKRSASRDGP